MKTIPFDIEKLRQDFPILHQTVHGNPLVYLDNAATSQKPQTVIDTIQNFYQHDYANVHRAVHTLGERATSAFEETRKKVQKFLNAKEEREIIFVRGTTEAINLVAESYGSSQLKMDDEIIISHLEHHSNIVPWQRLCQKTGAVLRVIPVNDAGELLLEEYEKLLSSRTKIVAIVHMSNSLGTINPIKQIIKMAHDVGAVTLIDGAQAISHLPVDVQELDCDFYAFSAHKFFGPSGVGVLYGKAGLLENMPPYQSGGDMISQVTFAKTSYREIPYKFEAGTPNITDTVGLGAAIDYFLQLDAAALKIHEQELLSYAMQNLLEVPELRLIGTAANKAAILSFILEDIHAHDIGTILDHEGVAVRTGHHCTMPLMERFKVPATVRASFAFYNTRSDIDALVRGLYKVREMFS